MQRRAFLHGLVGALLIIPMQAFAKFAALMWNKPAFEATQINEASRKLNIELVAPDRAENGAIVQVQVTSNIPNTESITLLVEHNPTPLIASFVFTNGALPFVITRIKMADTSSIKAVIKAGDQYFTAFKNVEVLENGCG